MSHMNRRVIPFLLGLAVLLIASGSILIDAVHAVVQTTGATAGLVPWPYVAADPSASRYSPLTDLNRENVGGLQVAWEWDPKERTNGKWRRAEQLLGHGHHDRQRGVHHTMYTRVVALDAETGTKLWRYDPKPTGGARTPR